MSLNLNRVFLTGLLLLSALKASASRKLLAHKGRPFSFIRQQQQGLVYDQKKTGNSTIVVNDKETFQSMDGFGFALTGGSAQHIVKMSASARAALLKELFATDGNNIGISYIRLSIGASDLNEKIFSYNDLPEGETDPDQSKFELGLDRRDVIPVMKEILAINPNIRIMGSPWSPPLWMKTSYDARGGHVKTGIL